MNIVIPMAGLGSRFPEEQYKAPKPFIPIGKNGETMIEMAIESLGLQGTYHFIVNEKYYHELEILLCQFMVDPFNVIPVNYLTDGPASSVLLAKSEIDNDKPLIITNCDQIMEWNSLRFKKFLKANNSYQWYNGIVVTYNVQTEKNSYVRLEKDESGYEIAVEFAEKKIISEHSLNGIHYWLRGSDFVRSAEKMIEKDIRVNNEFYIAPTYNELIAEGKKIKTHKIRLDEHWAVGTPEDLQKYLDHAKV